MANNHYEPELKKRILSLYFEEGRTKKSLTEEFNLGKGTLTYWIIQHRKEAEHHATLAAEDITSAEILKLRQELSEVRKENAFLKKAAAFFAKETQ